MSEFVEPVLSACIVLHHSGMGTLHTVQCFQESDIALELHVVDHSPRSTLSLHMLWQCPGIQYYQQPQNPGFASGQNVPLPYLRSQYHLICHPDVTFDDALLSRMVSYMELHQECMILSPKVISDKGEEQFLPRRAPTFRHLLGNALVKWGGIFKRWHAQYTLAGESITTPTAVETASGCFLLIRTGLLQHLKGLGTDFVHAHACDDLCRRAREFGTVVYHPDMVVTHHRKPRRRSLSERLRRLRDALHYLRKWRKIDKSARRS